MIVYVNSLNQIKDVYTTEDLTLKALEIDDDTNPFKGWPVSKICCYMVTVVDRRVTMMAPYIDSRVVDNIGQLGNQNEATKNTVDISLGVTENNVLSRDYIAKQMNRLQQIMLSKAQLSEDESLEVSDLYPLWEIGKNYKVDTIIKWGWDDEGFSALYRVLQEHVSQEGWEPDKVPSLYKRIGFNPSGYPIWVQPLSDVDSYDKGEKVSHKDKIWESDIDHNVWEPGVYGWTEVEE